MVRTGGDVPRISRRERAGAEGAVGRAMGVRAEGGRGPEAGLVDHVRDTSLLQRGGLLGLEQRRG